MKSSRFLILSAIALVIVGCGGKSSNKGGHTVPTTIDTAKAGVTPIPPVSHFDTDPSHTPEFPGGFDAMRAYIKSHLRIPAVARDAHKEGRVIVKARIGADGSVGDCTVFTSDDAAFNSEALRVVRSMPRFTPAHKDGKPVAADVNIAVMFRLK